MSAVPWIRMQIGWVQHRVSNRTSVPATVPVALNVLASLHP